MSQDHLSPRLRQALDGIRRLPNRAPSQAFNANVLAALARAQKMASLARTVLMWVGGASFVCVSMWVAGFGTWMAFKFNTAHFYEVISVIADPRPFAAASALHAAKMWLGLLKLVAFLQTLGGVIFKVGIAWSLGLSLFAMQFAAAIVLTGLSWMVLTRNWEMQVVGYKRRSL